MGIKTKIFVAGFAVLVMWLWRGDLNDTKTYAFVAGGTLAGLILWDLTEKHLKPEMLKGKRVIVTGASSGIGEALALLYAKNGASVLICARREHLLQKVVSECRRIGDKNAIFEYRITDMNNIESIDGFIEEATSALGGLDHLILNHGDLQMQDYWSRDKNCMAKLKQVVNINFISYIKLATDAIPYLRKSKGCIGISASITGHTPFPYCLPYSSSKTALEKFFWGLRQEFTLEKIDISITVCTLGVIKTKSAIDAIDYVGNVSKQDMGLFLKLFPPVTTDEGAYNIVRATTFRKNRLIYPSSQWTFTRMILSVLWPEAMEIFKPVE